MTLWLTLLGMAVGTFALRAAFLVLPPGHAYAGYFAACTTSRRRFSPRSGRPKCWCKMNNCPPALSQLL